MKICLILVSIIFTSCSDSKVQDFSAPEPDQEKLSLLAGQCVKSPYADCLERQYLLSAINSERGRLSLPALSTDSKLDAIAQAWACQLNKMASFDHGAWAQRQRSQGFLFPMGENLLRFDDEYIDMNRARRAVYLWQKSPNHYQHWIQPRTTHIGTGICKSHGVTTFVHEFAAL